MRKLFCVLCVLSFCFSSAAVAGEDYCSIFQISIKNNTAADCVLKKSYIPLGKLIYDGSISEVIFRDKEVSFFLNWHQSHYLIAALMQSYQCGDHREIALYSTTPAVEDSSILEKRNMDAKFITQTCNEHYKRSWKIWWELREPEQPQV